MTPSSSTALVAACTHTATPTPAMAGASWPWRRSGARAEYWPRNISSSSSGPPNTSDSRM